MCVYNLKCIFVKHVVRHYNNYLFILYTFQYHNIMRTKFNISMSRYPAGICPTILLGMKNNIFSIPSKPRSRQYIFIRFRLLNEYLHFSIKLSLISYKIINVSPLHVLNIIYFFYVIIIYV